MPRTVHEYDPAMTEGRLAGLVAVVVGAGQTPGETIGNGRAIATTFAREGADVLCVDRIADRAEETVASIRDAGGNARAFTADVTADEQCAATVSHASERWGSIDVLVNVVGIGGRGDGPAHSADAAAFERIVDVNLTAMWRMCRAALPSMREQRRGSIVNVSSAASFAGGFQVAYEVSKAGVNRLTTSIAQSNASRGCGATRSHSVWSTRRWPWVGSLRPEVFLSSRCARSATARSRSWAAWERRGMQRTLRCSSHPTRLG